MCDWDRGGGPALLVLGPSQLERNLDGAEGQGSAPTCPPTDKAGEGQLQEDVDDPVEN